MSTEKHAHGFDIMLDTVDLKIRHPAFTVLTPRLFSPQLDVKRTDEIPRDFPMKNLYKKYIQNTPSHERKIGVANIALTVYRRFEDGQLQHDLHIRASLAKLLFGENLHEVRQKHLGRIVARIHERLLRMGIATTEQAIREALITKVDFCKNMDLPFPLTVREVLEELYKADMGERMQVNMREYLDDGMREYREHGESLHFHTTSRQIVF